MAQLILGWEKFIPIQIIVSHALFHVNIIATVCKYINKFLKSTSAEPYMAHFNQAWHKASTGERGFKFF